MSTETLGDETTLVLGWLAKQRHALRVAAYGLTDEQGRLTPTAGTLSIVGLVRHVAQTERGWVDRIPAADVPKDVRPFPTRQAEYVAAFDPTGATLEQAFAGLDAAARHTDDVVRRGSLDDAVPAPDDAPWFQGMGDLTVRWILLHLISETARHAGHADLVRESIDGATAFPLQAGLEGWAETDWLTPWRPPT